MSVFGFRDESEFADAIGREMRQMSTHDRSPGQEPQPEQAGFRFRGKPGSPERLRQVEQLAGAKNRQLVQEIGRTLGGEKITKAVKEVQQNPSPEAISNAARLVAEFENVHVARAAIQALQPTGYGDQFIAELSDAADQVEARKEENVIAAERKRLADRQHVIADEYRRVRNDPAQLQAVDELAHGLGDLLYDPEMEDDEARVMLRTQSEMAKGQQRAFDEFAFHDALSEEFKRIGAPGSSWNDEERAKWESEMRQGTLNTFDRHNPSPEQATAAAFDSVAHDKAFAGTSPLEVGLKAEFERMAQHDSRAPHKERMAEENRRDWEAKYDEAGRVRE